MLVRIIQLEEVKLDLFIRDMKHKIVCIWKVCGVIIRTAIAHCLGDRKWLVMG